MTSLVALALFPIVFIGTYIYIRDEYEREPIWTLLKAIFFGCLSVIPVLFVGQFLVPLTPTEDPFQAAYTAFIVAALNEETFKLVVFLVFIKFSKDYNERLDGIVYAVCVSLGFAAVENILYVTNYGVGTGIMRTFTAVPAHAVFGVLMGYHYSKAKYDEQHKTLHYALCLLFPVFWHGAYDFILMVSPHLQQSYGVTTTVSILGFAIFVFYTYRMGIKRINIFRAFSKNRWKGKGNLK